MWRKRKPPKSNTKRKERLSEDVRRRKHNRNINRKALRSGFCYIWTWLGVLGLDMAGSSWTGRERRRSIDLRGHCH